MKGLCLNLSRLSSLVLCVLVLSAGTRFVTPWSPWFWIIIEVVACLALCSFVASACSQARGRSAREGFVLGLLFGPAGVVAAARLPAPEISIEKANWVEIDCDRIGSLGGSKGRSRRLTPEDFDD